jgi:hypothetical protein
MHAKRQFRRTAASGPIVVALALLAIASGAQAQEKASVSSSESVTAKVAVKSVDPATRRVVVTDEKGESVSIKAPPEARNFDNLKPGDTVTVTYTLQTEYVLSAPNTALPADAAAVLAARSAKGERPGGLVADQVVVTGAIIAIDQAKHTLKLVSPDGGAVHTVVVKTAEGLKAMPQMKVGDTITAYVTESMLLTVQPL